MAIKRVKSKRKRIILSDIQFWDLILMDCFYFDKLHTAFNSNEERMEAWDKNKDEIMKEWVEGKMYGMPGAWWQYETKLGHFPDKDGIREEDYLRENNLL